MIQFSMNRFLSVARWDVTINKRFYISQACALLAIATVPVLLRYLLWWVQGDVALFGRDIDQTWAMVEAQQSFAANMGKLYNVVSGMLPVVCLGYLLHNLATRQGRVAELTLPASNVERFVWHVVFWLVAPMLAFLVSLVVADQLHVLLSGVFGCPEGLESLLLSTLRDIPVQARDLVRQSDYPLAWASLYLSGFCFTSTFALGNAWKYRYNIIYTIMAHVGFWVVLLTGTLFLGGLLVQVVNPDWLLSLNLGLNWNIAPKTVANLLSLAAFLFNLALLVGIWALTYRLYCRAQITSRRNK